MTSLLSFDPLSHLVQFLHFHFVKLELYPLDLVAEIVSARKRQSHTRQQFRFPLEAFPPRLTEPKILLADIKIIKATVRQQGREFVRDKRYL